MPFVIPNVLDPERVEQFRQALAQAPWVDGSATAGHLSHLVKRNRQLPESHPVAIGLGNTILDALERHPVFMSYALPARIVPPLFNAYSGGEAYGRHTDGAVRPVPGQSQRIRTDMSATLFLSNPDEYDGGELVIEESNGEQVKCKYQAGTLLLYPSFSVHCVEPVVRGQRLASFFWLQSMIREHDRRLVLFNLDNVIQRLRRHIPEDRAIIDLTSHYHNLIRLWADP